MALFTKKKPAAKKNANIEAAKKFVTTKAVAKELEIEVEATQLDIDHIRLKFHGLPNDSGPDLIMSPILVRLTIYKLSDCLPLETVTFDTLKRMMVGVLFTKEAAAELISIISAGAISGTVIDTPKEEVYVPNKLHPIDFDARADLNISDTFSGRTQTGAEVIADPSGQPVMKCTNCERVGHIADNCPGME